MEYVIVIVPLLMIIVVYCMVRFGAPPIEGGAINKNNRNTRFRQGQHNPNPPRYESWRCRLGRHEYWAVRWRKEGDPENLWRCKRCGDEYQEYYGCVGHW